MLIWVDMETTGLDEQARNAYPLEIAAVLTDDQLNVAGRKSCVISFDLDLHEMNTSPVDPGVVEMHTANGLLAECASEHAWPSAYVVDQALSNWIQSFDLAEKPPLAGSTIGFDRAWMKRFFQEFHSKIHYRDVNVSTIKELTARWNPQIHRHYKDTMPPEKRHRALDDIMESIRELRLYKELIFDEVQAEYEH